MARYLSKGTSIIVFINKIYYGPFYGIDIRQGLEEGYRGA
jgi:hypothetical protein